jgi:hypothetical protein
VFSSSPLDCFVFCVFFVRVGLHFEYFYIQDNFWCRPHLSALDEGPARLHEIVHDHHVLSLHVRVDKHVHTKC